MRIWGASRLCKHKQNQTAAAGAAHVFSPAHSVQFSWELVNARFAVIADPTVNELVDQSPVPESNTVRAVRIKDVSCKDT